MKFVTTLERDEDGVWIVECPAIPGCVSQGRTREEALVNIHEAIAVCLEVRAERGLPLTIETQPVDGAGSPGSRQGHLAEFDPSQQPDGRSVHFHGQSVTAPYNGRSPQFGNDLIATELLRAGLPAS